MSTILTLRQKLSTLPVFSIADCKKILPKTSNAYLHLLLHNLMQKKEIFRITRGIYTFHPEITVAAFAYSPFYLGLQQALSIHNLWEQETNPIIITPRKVRTGLRKFEGNNYFVRKISRKMFFGYKLMNYSGVWVQVSDVEKTLIDMVYYKQYMGAELKSEFSKSINKTNLNTHLKKVPKKLREKILKLLKKKS